MKMILNIIYKFIVVSCASLHMGHAMEKENSKGFTDKQAMTYFENQMSNNPIYQNAFPDISNESEKLHTARTCFQGGYDCQEIVLKNAFKDYHDLENSAKEPLILDIGFGDCAFEVRVLRDMKKNIGLLVDGCGWTFAKSIGNIVDEEIYHGFVQDLPSTWYGKFDVAIWNFFVDSEFENTLTTVSRLLKPMGCYYATNNPNMISKIRDSEKIQEIDNEMSMEREICFDIFDCQKAVTLRFRKKS
jgi:hypothetical protein